MSIPKFTRGLETANIFEDTSDESIEVTLRIVDDFENRFNRNPVNKLRAAQVVQLLTSEASCLSCRDGRIAFATLGDPVEGGLSKKEALAFARASFLLVGVAGFSTTPLMR